MIRTFTLGAILVALLAPQAVAQDPLRDEVCDTTLDVCAGAGSCTSLVVVCVPRSCQPVFHCRSQTEFTSECAMNTTIEGETCQVVLGAGVRTNTPNHEASVRVALTNGTVDAFNLPNTWVAPSVETSLSSGAVDAGDIVLGLYSTQIVTADGQEHQWSHVGVVVYHGAGIAGPSQSARVGLYLLDSMPEGCYARLNAVASASGDCPRVVPSDILGPILP